jgi:hypothetical protein
MTGARHAQAKQNMPVSRIECRYVYEGGIKGEWVPLTEVMKTWLAPAEGYTVNRVEFQERSREPGIF